MKERLGDDFLIVEVIYPYEIDKRYIPPKTFTMEVPEILVKYRITNSSLSEYENIYSVYFDKSSYDTEVRNGVIDEVLSPEKPPNNYLI